MVKKNIRHTMIIFFALAFAAFGVFSPVHGKMPEVVENYDLKRYNPKEYGLKDLIFEVRYSNLVDQVKSRLGLEELADVYFKVYWIFPGQFEIKVQGLPEGFKKLKAELRSMMKRRLDMIVPQKMSKELRSYSMEVKSRSSGKRVIAKDPTNSKAVNKVLVDFSSSGKLSRIKTFSPMGTNVSEFEMSAKSWSHNKWLPDRLKTKTISGVQVTKMEQNISYKKVGNYGFPVKMKIRSTQQLVRNEEKGEDTSSEQEVTITFSNYQVNTGKAKKAMTSSP